MGARFDIRQFHDHVLGNGGVTLPMLRRQVERWIAGDVGGLNNYSARPQMNSTSLSDQQLAGE